MVNRRRARCGKSRYSWVVVVVVVVLCVGGTGVVTLPVVSVVVRFVVVVSSLPQAASPATAPQIRSAEATRRDFLENMVIILSLLSDGLHRIETLRIAPGS